MPIPHPDERYDDLKASKDRQTQVDKVEAKMQRKEVIRITEQIEALLTLQQRPVDRISEHGGSRQVLLVRDWNIAIVIQPKGT